MTLTQPETQYKHVDLFGGAITTLVPSTYNDVTDIRQVPDHQEVYLDPAGFTSIVVEILERVDKPDAEALTYHLEDLIEEDAGETKIWSTGEVKCAKLPTTPTLTLLATTPPGAKQRGRPNEPDFVGVLLTLIRLEEQKTDVIVVVNVPHVAGQYDPAELDFESGKFGTLVESAMEYRERLLGGFDVRDWGLFVQE